VKIYQSIGARDGLFRTICSFAAEVSMLYYHEGERLLENLNKQLNTRQPNEQFGTIDILFDDAKLEQGEMQIDNDTRPDISEKWSQNQVITHTIERDYSEMEVRKFHLVSNIQILTILFYRRAYLLLLTVF